jgi:hypothetical protein
MPGNNYLLRNAIGRDQTHAGKTGLDNKENSSSETNKLGFREAPTRLY